MIEKFFIFLKNSYLDIFIKAFIKKFAVDYINMECNKQIEFHPANIHMYIKKII
jgi:hypothetical protein